MYGFLLGREFRISVAEIISVFPNIQTIYQNKQVLIADNIDEEEILSKAKNLWGTIKIISLDIANQSIEELIHQNAPYEGKYHYALSVFWEKQSLKDILLKVKKRLKADKISSRFTNKDFKNLTSAQIIWENLVRKKSDYNYINTGEKSYFWRTIWVQDIYAYSKRDYDKTRDMQVGMLPPKLSQMMINLSGGKTIYDPFVWLGTVLIESLHMGNKKIFGSDLSDQMVKTSKQNCEEVSDELFLNATIGIEKLNAKFIHESSYFDHWVDAIVSEWYLGEVMTKKNISLERIQKQQESLTKIYEPFFAGLQKVGYKWTIVISFPFWDLKGKYNYFNEIYPILGKYCEILPFFPADYEIQASKSGSLLYKRDSQLVGREIFKLKIK